MRREDWELIEHAIQRGAFQRPLIVRAPDLYATPRPFSSPTELNLEYFKDRLFGIGPYGERWSYSMGNNYARDSICIHIRGENQRGVIYDRVAEFRRDDFRLPRSYYTDRRRYENAYGQAAREIYGGATDRRAGSGPGQSNWLRIHEPEAALERFYILCGLYKRTFDLKIKIPTLHPTGTKQAVVRSRNPDRQKVTEDLIILE